MSSEKQTIIYLNEEDKISTLKATVEKQDSTFTTVRTDSNLIQIPTRRIIKIKTKLEVSE